MNDRERREYEMYLRALLYLNKYFDILKDIPAIAAARDTLQTETDRIGDLGADKVDATGDSKDATIYKGDMRDALRDAMQDIASMWRPMAKNHQDAQNKFRMPRGSDQLMIDTAGQFIEDATSLEGDFTARGMNAGFVVDLTAKRDAFDAVVNESEAARLDRIGVNAQFREPLKKCLAAVHDVDPIIEMVFRNDPGKRAEWISASHIERA